MSLKHLAAAAAVVALFGACAPPAAPPASVACTVPADLAPAPVLTPPEDEIQSGVTNAYYLLALTWSPEWCRTNGQGTTKEELQCDREARGFVLHGLWPNGVAKPYPRYCRPVGGIDAQTVRQMFCRTPSPGLMQHEWQAHGACGWPDAKSYFRQSAALYDRIVFPKIETIPNPTAGAVRQAFIASNPWLSAGSIYLQVDKAQRLTEIRLCYDLKFQPMRCMSGTGTPDAIPIRLTPSANGGF
ncbi:ribonuclease T2 [Caulobacter ginsengisoli]|uniref:Ribonuclease T2 n=1 Tax=Caulobacter ginsengisoli TaxID=400775 RepID=A0ABU0IQL7_9CAUL|nr:ribonuclease T [Caulobacter ginsengisoli]MDQ0463695.1 ribonuclease T2 [Caulobacter ginsengisoli]